MRSRNSYDSTLWKVRFVMSTDNHEVFTKVNLDLYFRELSKEYKRLGGRKLPVEIILIGGAAIIESYRFREMTTDIDAVLPSVSIMKDAINHVGDRFGLPNGWLNANFIHTESYSRRIGEFSKPYRTFNQVLNVRIVTAEYLIAMKLRSGRKYKNDLSDVVGILAEHEQNGNPIGYEQIDTAVKNLYGGWEAFSQDAISFLQDVLKDNRYLTIYDSIRQSEMQAKEILLDFQQAYPGVMKEDNVDSILENKAKTGSKTFVLDQLAALKKQRERTSKTTENRSHKDRDER